MSLSPQAIEKLEKIASDVATREGCQIYDIEFAGNGRVLRVFIDKEGAGVSIDDCANVSRGMNLLLDVEDPIPGGAYNLEVSSPGLDRVLKKTWHYEKVQGKKIWVKLNQALEAFGCQHKKLKSAKQISEVLQAVTPEGVQFKIEEENISVPFSAIEKAKLVFEEKVKEKPTGKKR